MSCRTILPFAIVVSLLTVTPLVRAELPHALGRYTGVGWSDGYHSRVACPPKRQIVPHTQPAVKPVPWWAIPASDADSEQLPSPATNEPATSRSPQPTGTSLFRQPGEGSSVSAPSLMR
jgi:hypothetical protein